MGHWVAPFLYREEERMKTRFLIWVVLVFIFVSGAAQNVSASLTDGLIAWWPFDGSTFDATGNGHDGSIAGTGVTVTTDRFGNQNGAYNFSNQSYISVPDSPDFTLGSNPFTISLWVKFDVLGSYYLIGHDNGPGSQNKWIFWAGNSDTNSRLLFVTYPGLQVPADGYNWANGSSEWYHFAITRNGVTWTLYVNGIEIENVIPNNATELPDPSHDLWIGSAETDHPERYLRGSLDDVRIYNRALSAQEISDLFNAVPIPGDFAPYDCDVDGSDLAVLIASIINNTPLIDLATFAESFGESDCP
jgi:hypothetical protein